MTDAKKRYVKRKLNKKLNTTANKKARKRIKSKIRALEQPKENTKPELYTKKLLEQLNVVFIQQYELSGFYYDFFLPEHNVLIEVNGDYFHSNPTKYVRSKWNRMQKKNYKRDKIKLAVALRKGYRIFYIWESDLKAGKIKHVRNHLKEELETENSKAVHMLEHIVEEYKDFYKLKG